MGVGVCSDLLTVPKRETVRSPNTFHFVTTVALLAGNSVAAHLQDRLAVSRTL